MNRPLRPFRPCQPPQVVRDNTLGGKPVLLLGWWLGRDGQPEAAEVLSFGSTRHLSDVAGYHGEPATPTQPTLAAYGGWPEPERADA
jgi:hypothetical protein